MPGRRKFAIFTAALAVLAAMGIAFAAWTGTGTGSGRARSITVQAVTVSPEDGTADLYPGFTQGDLYFGVDNTPNPFGIDFTSWTTGTVTSSDPVNCPASNVTVTASGTFSPALAVNGGQNLTGQSIADIVSMAAAAPDGCQGQSFDIQLTITGTTA